jgi:cell division protein ZapE
MQTAYAEALRTGQLKADMEQAKVATALEQLAHHLTQTTKRSLLSRMFTGRNTPNHRGMYIYGGVGRGKTMLMDMFFNSLEDVPKLRQHFHAFMQEIHGRREAYKGNDIIAHIADEIASSIKVLCLDEMQIVDIADAMIVGRLFEALDQRGICLVTTSNLPPEALYTDGLNRELFLPFIAKLRQNLEVIALDSPTDYRLGRVKSHETFIVPPSKAKIDRLWSALTDGAEGEVIKLDVLGRKRLVPLAAKGCARFTFADLCEAPLGPADYLAIARSFRTVFVENIPVLGQDRRNEAKRFVLMIDTFYDARIRMVASAAAEPEKLHPKGKHSFEFQRTVSRLKEMQSASWWGKSIPET